MDYPPESARDRTAWRGLHLRRGGRLANLAFPILKSATRTEPACIRWTTGLLTAVPDPDRQVT